MENRTIQKKILLALCVVGLSACSIDTWNEHYAHTPATSAYDSMKSDASVSEYFALVEKYKLEYLLKGSEITVFAPTNGSFSVQGLAEEEVIKLIRKHIVRGRISEADFLTMKACLASNGEVVPIDGALKRAAGALILVFGTQLNGSLIHKIEGVFAPSLFDYLLKNKEHYSYMLSLYDNIVYDDASSIRYVDAHGKRCIDSVFVASSTLLDPYLKEEGNKTIALFTDDQYDAMLRQTHQAVRNFAAIGHFTNQPLFARTVIQSIFKGELTPHNSPSEWESVNGYKQVVSNASFKGEAEHLPSLQLLKYADHEQRLALNYFNLHIECDDNSYTFVSGGGNSHEVVNVPLFGNGNGKARRIWGTGAAHAYFVIGGINGEKLALPALNNMPYKVRICVSLRTVSNIGLRMLTPAFPENNSGEFLVIPASPYFDTNKNFINTQMLTPNQEMTLMEFPIYTLTTTKSNINGFTHCFQFHFDYRAPAVWPTINGLPSTADQRGFIIDYLELEPQFN